MIRIYLMYGLFSVEMFELSFYKFNKKIRLWSWATSETIQQKKYAFAYLMELCTNLHHCPC